MKRIDKLKELAKIANENNIIQIELDKEGNYTKLLFNPTVQLEKQMNVGITKDLEIKTTAEQDEEDLFYSVAARPKKRTK